MRRFAKYIYLSLSLLLLALLTPALAQNSDEKSAFIKYVGESISTDNFKIGLNGLQGHSVFQCFAGIYHHCRPQGGSG